MALNGEKPFGMDVQKRLDRLNVTSEHTHAHKYEHDDADKYEHEHKDDPTHAQEHTHTPKIRERKTFRAQILTYPSLIEKLDRYAQMHGLSRAEAFERAVSEFLDKNT